MKTILSLILMAAASPMAWAQLRYDAQPPQMQMPVLEREASAQYDLDNQDTYAVYRATHVVAEGTDRTRSYREYAIWCTPQATYLAERVYGSKPYQVYHPNITGYIQDCATGIKYRQTDELGYPRHLGRYLVHALPFTYIVNIEVYPPLPATCTSINYGYDDCDDPAYPDSRKGRVREQNLQIETLQRNQPLMQVKLPTIVN